MGNPANCFGFEFAANFAAKNQAPAVPALWRGKLGWAPPAGFVDYTPCMNRIVNTLHPNRARIAAGAGSRTNDVLRKVVLDLGLDAEGARLDVPALSKILTRGAQPQQLAAALRLSRMSLLNLAVRFQAEYRSFSCASRSQHLPLSPNRPTLAHVLACEGREVRGVDTCTLGSIDDESQQGAKPTADSIDLAARFTALREAGVDLNTRSVYGRTPLHLAVLAGNLDAVKALVMVGANIHSRDKYGNTPLMLALRRRFEDATSLLSVSSNPLATAQPTLADAREANVVPSLGGLGGPTNLGATKPAERAASMTGVVAV